MTLSEKRKGEIARTLLISRLTRDGVNFSGKLKEELVKEALALKIPEEEMMEFIGDIFREVVEKLFPKDPLKVFE